MREAVAVEANQAKGRLAGAAGSTVQQRRQRLQQQNRNGPRYRGVVWARRSPVAVFVSSAAVQFTRDVFAAPDKTWSNLMRVVQAQCAAEVRPGSLSWIAKAGARANGKEG